MKTMTEQLQEAEEKIKELEKKTLFKNKTVTSDYDDYIEERFLHDKCAKYEQFT